MGRGGAAAAGMEWFFMTVSIIRRGREIIGKEKAPPAGAGDAFVV